jgi:hypothetical protein
LADFFNSALSGETVHRLSPLGGTSSALWVSYWA